jgi:hypothetical protein
MILALGVKGLTVSEIIRNSHQIKSCYQSVESFLLHFGQPFFGPSVLQEQTKIVLHVQFYYETLNYCLTILILDYSKIKFFLYLLHMYWKCFDMNTEQSTGLLNSHIYSTVPCRAYKNKTLLGCKARCISAPIAVNFD